MSALEQRGQAILRRLPPHAEMAEVGVLLGRLSEYILSNSDVPRLLMIDSWAPTSEQPDRYKATGDTHAFASEARAKAARQEAIERARKFPGRAVVVEGWSADVARTVPDASLDMVFLDADHSYEGVRDDIAAWLPKVRAGGWIGGHDYDNPAPGYNFSGVERAVHEAFGEVETDDNFTWFTRVP